MFCPHFLPYFKGENGGFFIYSNLIYKLFGGLVDYIIAVCLYEILLQKNSC